MTRKDHCVQEFRLSESKEEKKERRKINKTNQQEKGSREGFEQVKDSINQKAQRRERVHAIDSTRGMADRLVEERCINVKNCSSQIDAKSEAHGASLHYSASTCTLVPVRPKSRFLQG